MTESPQRVEIPRDRTCARCGQPLAGELCLILRFDRIGATILLCVRCGASVCAQLNAQRSRIKKRGAYPP